MNDTYCYNDKFNCCVARLLLITQQGHTVLAPGVVMTVALSEAVLSN